MASDNQIPVFSFKYWEIDLARRELRAQGRAVPLGSRAFETIEVLVQSAGALVAKNELIKRVWPNAIVEENTLLVHVSAIRKALGPDRDLLKTISGRGYCLLGTWTRHQGPVSTEPNGTEQLVSPPIRPFVTNAPAPVAPLIGRTAELQELHDLLSAHRAITLTGPGGIGKTKLALATTHSLSSTFGGDVWWVELASLSNARLVSSAVSRALELKIENEEISAQAVAYAIGGKKALLVLDNCEHVIGGAAEIAEAIIRICPNASILASSREALGIEGEHVFHVPPLDVPDQHEKEPEVVLGHSAVQLFVTRAKELVSEFHPRPEDLPAISGICRRLDGIPLAIEFAAARAVTLGLSHVAARLDDLFELLTNGRRTALPRHQTLRATLDWSHDLLPSVERRLLRRLAVFSGGFTVEGALAVMDEGRQEELTILSLISNLVSKSLAVLDGSVPGGRWHLLDTVRAYALEKLNQSGEAGVTARRQAMFFRDLFSAITLGDQSPIGADDIARYVREIDNVRAALDWAFSPAGDEVIGIVLTAAHVPLWLHLSLLVESCQRAEHALAILKANTSLEIPLRTKVQLALVVAEVGSTLGWIDFEILREALTLAERSADTDGELLALWSIWSRYYYRGAWRAARPVAERFAHVASHSGNPATILMSERLMGTTMHYIGDQKVARLHLEHMLDNYDASADQVDPIRFHHDQSIVSRAILARVLCLQGHFDQARRTVDISMKQALAKQHTLSQRYTIGWSVIPIALMTGDLASAEHALEMFDDISEALQPYWKFTVQGLRGIWLIKRGDLAPGSELLATVLESFANQGWDMCFPEMVGCLAEGLAGLGRTTEALTTIDDALDRVERGGERWCEPDLLRIKGDVLALLTPTRDAKAAEEHFLRSISIAREQDARLWELQAATSLARLWAESGRAHCARQALAPVYDKFTEGSTTVPVRSAGMLLDSLPV